MDNIDSLNKRVLELEKENRELNDIFGATGDLIFVIDNNNTITKVNKACISFLNIEPREIIGKKCYELVHKLSTYWPGCPFESTKKDKRIHTEEVSDPSIGLDLLVTTAPIFDGTGNMIGAVHIAKDITELKKQREALCDSEAKYKTMFESSSDAIMLIEPGDGFLAGNPATIKLFGCNNEKDFISKSPADLSPKYQPDGQLSIDKSKHMMQLAMEKGSAFFEWRHKRINGEEFPATVLLTKMEFCSSKILQATVRDITDNIKIMEELRKEKEEERIILNSVPVGIFYKDKENCFVRVNKPFAEIMQMSESDMEGKSSYELYPKDQADAYWADDKEIMESGKPKINIIERMDTKRGRLWVRTDKVPHRDEKGNIIGVIGFCLDITERKLTEEAIAKKVRDLEIFYKAAIDREMKIKELKKKIQELETRLKG